MLIDLHTHTCHLSSCSSLSLAELIARCRAAGLDGICLTEHDKMWSAEDLAQSTAPSDFLILRGMEVSTVQGHVLVYGLPGPVDGLWSLRRLREVADEYGAVLVKSHPLRDGHVKVRPDGTPRDGEIGMFALYDALEIWSGGESDTANALAASLARAYGFRGVGGGDVHAPSEVGRFATRFERDILSEADLAAELRAGRFTAVDLRGVTGKK
ncbi:MAG: CehA/McbA family metallohydrolase [Thermodesulfobacteriota bacterium]